MSWSQIAGYPPAAYGASAVFQAYAAGLPGVCRHLGEFPRSPRALGSVLEELRAAHAARGNAQPFHPCVVTGQQPHWLGGPAFVLYKCASAISAATSLSRAFDLEVRPLFWSHSDDSDVSEVDHVHAINPNWDVQRFSLGIEPGRLPLYETRIPASAAAHLEAFLEALPGSRHHDELAAALRRVADTGDATFADHFAACLRLFFGASTPEIIEPRDHREACKEVVLRYLEVHARCEEIWKEIDASLEANGIPRPLDPLEAPPFFILGADGDRQAVRRSREDDSFLLEGARLTREAMIERVRAGGAEVLPGVILRVLAQSRILPVVAYIGGTAEIAYQIYALPLFPHFELVRPAVLPRFSATILEESHLELIERFGVEQPLQVEYEALTRALPGANDPAIDALLAALATRIDEDFEELCTRLEEIDSSLPRSLRTSAGNMKGQLEKTSKKIERVLRNRAGTGNLQARKLAAWLRPREGLQERTLTCAQLLSRYGTALPGHLLGFADPFNDTHRMLLHR